MSQENIFTFENHPDGFINRKRINAFEEMIKQSPSEEYIFSFFFRKIDEWDVNDFDLNIKVSYAELFSHFADFIENIFSQMDKSAHRINIYVVI